MFNIMGIIAVVTSLSMVHIPDDVSLNQVTSEYQMTNQEQIIHQEMALKNTNRYNAEAE